MDASDEPVAFVAVEPKGCEVCGVPVPVDGIFALVWINRRRRLTCLACAGMGQLKFLGAGDSGLTHRVRHRSRPFVKVLRWNVAERVFERRGALVEPRALRQALADRAARLAGTARLAREARRSAFRPSLGSRSVKCCDSLAGLGLADYVMSRH